MENFNFEEEDASLKRRRKVQQAILENSIQSMAKARSGQGNVLNVLGAWAGEYDAERKDRELAPQEKALRQRYNQQLGQEADQYLTTTQGQAADPVPADGFGPVRPAVAGNPRKAVIEAMTSQLPEMQGLGKAVFSQLGKQEKPEYMNIDGTLVEVPKVSGGQGRNAGTFAKPEKPGDKFGPMTVIKGPDGKPVMGQWNEKDGQFHPKGSGGQSITVNAQTAAQKQGLEAWAKEAVGTVKELSGMARSSVKMLGQLNQVEKLSDNGTFNGPTANGAVWLGQLFGAAGVPMSAETKAKLSNSQTFGNTAAELWLQTMNANGGSRGLVKEESERIAANLPSLIQTPDGRKRMVAVMRQVAQQNIEDAQRANIELGDALQTQDPSKFTFGLTNVNLPNTMPTEAAPNSVANSGKPKVSGKW